MQDLSETERRVWSAYSRGTWVDLRSGDPQLDQLACVDQWEASRVVRAEALSALLLGAGESEPGFFPALRLRGARITGRLDLMGATVAHALVCEHCYFEQEPRFVEATTKTVRIVESRLPGFNGARMRAEGIVNLYGTVIDGTLRLDRAKVVGELSLRAASVGRDPAAVAVAGEGLSVDGPVECNDGFACRGSLVLRGARIGGPLVLEDATLTSSGPFALRADNAVIEGRLNAARLKARGEVRVSNTQIAGWMNLVDAQLRNPGDVALGAGGLVVSGGLWCGEAFTAEGQIRLIGARLGGNLSLVNATLSHPGGLALNLDRATLGDLDAKNIHVSAGTFSFVNAQITGQVDFSDARLDAGVGQVALVGDGAAIDRSLNFNRLESHGALNLRTCRIGGRVALIGATLDNAAGVALRLSRSEIAADMFCGDMTVTGSVKLTGARVGSHLQLNDVRLRNPGGIALDAETLQAMTLTLSPREPVTGSVVFRSARVDRLRDDPQSWPAQLVLDGFVYGALEPRLPARERLRWLAREADGYQSQPYEQLAAHYTAIGQPAEARHVLHAKERRHRDTKPLSGRIWGTLQDATVAYGYQPWRAVLWLALLLAVGSVVYGVAPPPALVAGQSPHFNAVIYTLDLLLPIVDLGQKHAFNPAGAEQWLSYALIAAGWILATTIAAGVARTLNRG